MSDKEFIDDDLERMLYYKVPTSNLMLGGLMNVSSLISLFRNKRKHVEKKEEAHVEGIKIPSSDREIETISI